MHDNSTPLQCFLRPIFGKCYVLLFASFAMPMTQIKKNKVQPLLIISLPVTVENISGIIDTEIAGSSGYTDHFPTFIILDIGSTKKVKKETF